MVFAFFGDGNNFFKSFSFFNKFSHGDDLHSDSKSGAERVDNGDFGFGIFFAKFLGGNFRCADCSAYSNGKADINDFVAVLNMFFKAVMKSCGVYH